MAISTGLTDASKQAAADAVAAPADVVRCILIKVGAAGTYNGAYATAYPGAGLWSDECANGNGYTQGGQVLTGRSGGPAGGQGYVDYADAVWMASGALSAIGAAFWNVTQNRWIGFLDFGGTKTATDDLFTVQIPGDGGNGLVRIG